MSNKKFRISKGSLYISAVLRFLVPLFDLPAMPEQGNGGQAR
jgi:hypothetical protein